MKTHVLNQLVSQNTEREVYGCTKDEMEAGFKESMKLSVQPSPERGYCSLALLMLSQIQTSIRLGYLEKVEQDINRVKHLISTRELKPALK